MHSEAMAAAKEHLSATLLAERLERQQRLEVPPSALTEANAGLNVHAVGIGRKIKNGVPLDDMAVRVYVSRKFKNPNDVPERYRVKRLVNGVPTDVIEAAPAMFAQCTNDRRSELRPVIGGVSASHMAAPFGTLGCFCRSTLQEDGSKIFVLSCNHVFGHFDAANEGDDLFQPSRQETNAPPNAKAFATFKRSVAIQDTDNLVDAAIGVLVSEFRNEICTIGRVNGSAVGAENIKVVKHGRTSGRRNGIITDESHDHVLPHPVSGKLIKFVNQLKIEPDPLSGLPFADAGDSGSLVLRADDNAAVGLLFAKDADGSGTFAIANRFELVRQHLHIDLL